MLKSIFAAALVLLCAVPAIAGPLDDPLSRDRVRQEIVDRLRAHPEIADVTVRADGSFDYKGRSGGTAVATIDNIFLDLGNTKRAERDGILEMYLRSAIRAVAPVKTKIDLSSLRITVYDDVYFREAFDQVAAPEGTRVEGGTFNLIRRPLASGLWAVIVIDTPDDVTTFTQESLATMPNTAAEVWAAADANLARHVSGFKLIDHEWVWLAQVDGYYENALMAVPAVWPDIAQKIGGTPIVATPSRGLLLIVNNDAPETLAALRRITTKFFNERGHKITDQIYRWTPEGWQTL